MLLLKEMMPHEWQFFNLGSTDDIENFSPNIKASC